MTTTSTQMDNPDFYIEGFKIALDNSFSLKKIADLAFTEGEYGIACSLNILAAEEAVKANFILIKHYNPNTEINDFEKVFKKHPVKHDHLKGIAAVHEVQLKRFRTVLEVFDKYLAIIDQMPENLKEKSLDDFSTWFEIKDWVRRFEERKVTYEEIALWADKANNDKNNGFYVDLRNGKWTTPKSFIQEKYVIESKYTEAILDYVKGTEKHPPFSPSIKDRTAVIEVNPLVQASKTEKAMIKKLVQASRLVQHIQSVPLKTINNTFAYEPQIQNNRPRTPLFCNVYCHSLDRCLYPR